MERITLKYIYEFQCMLERTDAVTNEVLQPITYVLAYQHYATSAISSVIFFFGPCACTFAALCYILGQQRGIALISLPYKDWILIIIL